MLRGLIFLIFLDVCTKTVAGNVAVVAGRYSLNDSLQRTSLRDSSVNEAKETFRNKTVETKNTGHNSNFSSLHITRSTYLHDSHQLR